MGGQQASRPLQLLREAGAARIERVENDARVGRERTIVTEALAAPCREASQLSRSSRGRRQIGVERIAELPPLHSRPHTSSPVSVS